MLKPGDMVGPYEIKGFVGQGGMGQVYRAFDPRLERTVALKIIVVSPDAARTKGPLKGDSERGAGEQTQLSARWLREARAVASLSHPNVVAIYDVGESDGRLWLAMEYVVGAALRQHVGNDELPLARRVRFLVDVARALEAAHQSGIIHRDIKPENVMIREDGGVKVLDFGIARRTVAKTPEDQHKVDTVTGGGSISGTPVYMAPEQIKGGEVDSRCDQFAWGVMAYELVTGARPWNESGDVLSIVANILTEITPPIRSRTKDVPNVVEETIHRALSKDPAARFSSMAHVADALEPFASLNTSGERVRVTTAKHDDAAQYAATTKVPTTVSVHPATPHATDPPPALPSKKRARQLAIPLMLLGALGATVYLATKNPGPVQTTRITATPSVTPRPLTDKPQAESAYHEAMRAWHDGAATTARNALKKATELDEDFAAAHLELALQSALVNERATAQAEFALAFAHRQFLLPRDEALLQASLPYLQPEGRQPDLGEWETRLATATFQHPKDLEIHYWLGRAHQQQGDHTSAKEVFEKLLKLDGDYAPALAALARTEKSLDNTGEGLALTERCLKRSPIASMCVETRFELLFNAGECGRARDEATRWAQLEPKAPKPHAMLARTLLAEGAPLPSVVETLGRRWSLVPPAEQKRQELWDRSFLAAYEGDFVKAEELAKDYEAALPFDADSYDHAAPSRLRVNVLRETEKTKEASKVARDFLDRKAAWPQFPFASDPSVDFFEPIFRAGDMTQKELEAKRSEWLAAEERRVAEGHSARSPWLNWLSLEGGFAETREEAAAALASTPEGQTGGPGVDFALGKAHALAGHWDQAIPRLKRVVTTCNTFESFIVIQRARLFLAQAQEAKGDIPAARAGYQKILEAWPKTTGSRTAKKAAERLAALPAAPKE